MRYEHTMIACLPLPAAHPLVAWLLAGVCNAVLQQLDDVPILGVCLGHQALAHVHGGRVVHAPEPVHGRLSKVQFQEHELFAGIDPQGFDVVRWVSGCRLQDVCVAGSSTILRQAGLLLRQQGCVHAYMRTRLAGRGQKHAACCSATTSAWAASIASKATAPCGTAAGPLMPCMPADASSCSGAILQPGCSSWYMQWVRPGLLGVSSPQP